MTTFYYHQFQGFSKATLENGMELLPSDQRDRIRKFRKPQDAYASLAGKLLLLEGFKAFNISETLQDLRHTSYGKPYIENGSVSFSISHSGNSVGCIISTDTSSIGVDIEEIRPVTVQDFKSIWSDSEWLEIETNDLSVFYRYWTRKEAVVKAEGRGLSIPLQSIELHQSRAVLQNQIYYLKEINFQSSVMISIASVDYVDHMNTVTLKHFDASFQQY